MAADAQLINDYLLLGLRFDRIEDGYVDSFTGDPALRQKVADEAAPDPADLARQARRLLRDVDAVGLTEQRADYLKAHLRALECAGRKFAGEDVGFVDEVRAYFDVDIAKARYDVLLGELKLRQVAGILDTDAILKVDGLLSK